MFLCVPPLKRSSGKLECPPGSSSCADCPAVLPFSAAAPLNGVPGAGPGSTAAQSNGLSGHAGQARCRGTLPPLCIVVSPPSCAEQGTGGQAQWPVRLRMLSCLLYFLELLGLAVVRAGFFF
jgi:hypothetical protein